MKKTKLFLATLALTVAMSITAFAGEWKQDTIGWWYLNDNGSYIMNGWQTIGGKQYFFGADGYMLVNTTTPDGKQVGPDGALIEAPLFVFDSPDWSAVYTHYELTDDYKGKPVILVYYNFTNKSDERIGVHTSWMSLKAFQNEKECNDFVILETTSLGQQNAQKAIDPGTTINAADAFYLSDLSPITFTMKQILPATDANPKSDAVVTAILNLE